MAALKKCCPLPTAPKIRHDLPKNPNSMSNNTENYPYRYAIICTLSLLSEQEGARGMLLDSLPFSNHLGDTECVCQSKPKKNKTKNPPTSSWEGEPVFVLAVRERRSQIDQSWDWLLQQGLSFVFFTIFAVVYRNSTYLGAFSTLSVSFFWWISIPIFGTLFPIPLYCPIDSSVNAAVRQWCGKFNCKSTPNKGEHQTKSQFPNSQFR